MKTKFVTIFLIASIFFGIFLPKQSHTQVAEGVTVGASLIAISDIVEDVIDKAENTGDYLLFKAATELKSLIDSWERANSNLIDKSLDRLNDSQRKFFGDAEVAAEKIKRGGEEAVEGATKITELANQTVADLKIFDGKPGVFRYSPRITYPGETQNLNFVVRGINFDRGNPELLLPDGKIAERTSLLKQEVVFTVPISVFKYKNNKTSTAKFKFLYSNLSRNWLANLINRARGESDRAYTDLAIMQLPKTLGNYNLKTKVKQIKRDIWKGSREFHHSGRDSSRTFTQNPHANGWRIDISSIKRGKTWGEKGKECSLNSKNEHGFSIKIRTGTIRKLNNPNGAGYQHCIWNWQEYKDEIIIKDAPIHNGTISWNKDVLINLPDNKSSYDLTVNSFDGKEKRFVRSGLHTFYQVTEAGNSIVIEPIVPKDLNKL